jgi:3-dehydroquinate synthetase
VRARLNYGHTLAHALETVGGYHLRHGEAVAVGLVFAAELAGALERIPVADVERHRHVVSVLGLPSRAPAGASADDLLPVMRRDKKAAGGLTFVLSGPNGVERVDDPDPGALAKAFAAVGVST